MDRVGLIAAWARPIWAAGGDALLLIERGPWRLTNGWFALLFGMAARFLDAHNL